MRSRRGRLQVRSRLLPVVSLPLAASSRQWGRARWWLWMPGAPRFQHSSLRGAAAVVIDGGCRDIDEIRATKLWLASRFVTPLSGKTRLRVESIGDPAHLGGLLVRAGDLVVGDET